MCVKFPSINSILCTVYIPPNCSDSYFFLLIDFLSDLITNNHCIIVGDFNRPYISWQSLTSSSVLSNHFCDFIFDLNLTQYTHKLGNILDLVITSPEISISDLSVFQPINSIASDHLMISFIPFCNHCLHIIKKKCRYSFNFSKADYNSIASYMLDADFS